MYWQDKLYRAMKLNLKGEVMAAKGELSEILSCPHDYSDATKKHCITIAKKAI